MTSRKRFEQLLPCPCCGGRGALIRHEVWDAMGMRVICTTCKLATRMMPYGVGFARFDEQGRFAGYDREITPQEAAEDAARAWNRRGRQPEAAAEITGGEEAARISYAAML